jgi:hypothetical protein
MDTLQQIGCSTDQYPSVVVHDVSDASQIGVKRHRLLQANDQIDSAEFSAFLKRVSEQSEPLFYRSKDAGRLESGFIPEVNAAQVLSQISPAAVDSLILVSVSDPQLCPECAYVHSSMTVLRALADSQAPGTLQVSWLDGMDNDPPSESLTWNNVPTLFAFAAGSSEAVRYEGLTFSPEAIAAWLVQTAKSEKLKSLDHSGSTIEALPERIKDLNIREIVTAAIEQVEDEVDFESLDQLHHPGQDEL